MALPRDAQTFSEETGDAKRCETTKNGRVFGFGLNADAIRLLHVTTRCCPREPNKKDHAREVTEGRVRHVYVAVQELPRRLILNLRNDRDQQQTKKSEVDTRVHQTGDGVAHQGAHLESGAQVVGTLLEVLFGGGAVVGCAAFVVLDPQRDQPCGDDEHRGHGDVKRPVERVWKLRYFAAREAGRGKQVPLHLGRVFPMGDTRRDC